jgi:hydroxyacylglutathione hydrolase
MFPCLADNYGFLLHDREHGFTASIDTPDATAIASMLAEKKWRLTHIFNTHHHWDHAGGNIELKQITGCRITGPRDEADRIPGIDVQVGDGDIFKFGRHTVQVHGTPGHTLGHIVYHIPVLHIVFAGDTLFAMGCGRLFEGTPAQMWGSLQKLMRLPDITRIYCAHEYTQNNARFALTLEPRNPSLIKRAEMVNKMRAKDLPTIPTTMELEKKTNPFLRPQNREIRSTLNMEHASDLEVFARTRALKDKF